MVSDKVLLVDDNINILASFRRQLRKQFSVDTATGSREALKSIIKNGQYSVVVSDFRMPEMDGIKFLAKVKELAPDCTRIILTGHADLKAAIDAVNEGNIFRFLIKPCPLHILKRAIEEGIEQYQLITAERELLEQTLRGTIQILTEILEIVNPEAFGRASRIKRYVMNIALQMKVTDVWRFDTAAMLSQIGCIILPEETVKKFSQRQVLTAEESEIFKQHPLIASGLLKKIPRMKEVAEIIAYQEKHFDGSGAPADNIKGKEIPLGARILKVLMDFDALEIEGKTTTEALSELKRRSGWYDPDVLATAEEVIETQANYKRKSVSISELWENMILGEDVRTLKGRLLISKGQVVSLPMIQRLKNLSRFAGIIEPLIVYERIIRRRR
jgi:response regulator RpfG family c-di-GMP phosphodiesterase